MAKQRYIKLNGKLIPVSEEVYRAYYRPEWREKKQAEVRSDMEYSYEVMREDGFDIPAADSLVDEVAADKFLLDELYTVLAKLSAEERTLIDALYYQKKSERDVACEIGISQPTVHKRRNRILEKIKKFLK